MNEDSLWSWHKTPKMTAGAKTWYLATEMAVKRALVTGQKQFVRGSKMPKGTWVYSTGWVS